MLPVGSVLTGFSTRRSLFWLLLVYVVIFAIAWLRESARFTDRDIELTLDASEALYSLHPECHCARKGRALSLLRSSGSEAHHESQAGTFVGDSTCGDYATSLGAGQNVISYSLYNPKGNKGLERYLLLLPFLGQSVRSLYPGWRMRIYTNVTPESAPDAFRALCHLYCDNDVVDVCDVNAQPPVSGAPEHQTRLSTSFPLGMFWRFQPVGDLTVSRVLVRDLDSHLSAREAQAVSEWTGDGRFFFHAMRDAPMHWAKVQGNAWAVDNDVDRGELFSLSNLRVRPDPKAGAKSIQGKHFGSDWGVDQIVLEKKIWPLVSSKALVHASYHCQDVDTATVWPFSTKRQGLEYVGYGPSKQAFLQFIDHLQCPDECRPKDHKDWEKC